MLSFWAPTISSLKLFKLKFTQSLCQYLITICVYKLLEELISKCNEVYILNFSAFFSGYKCRVSKNSHLFHTRHFSPAVLYFWWMSCAVVSEFLWMRNCQHGIRFMKFSFYLLCCRTNFGGLEDSATFIYYVIFNL